MLIEYESVTRLVSKVQSIHHIKLITIEVNEHEVYKVDKVGKSF